MGGDAPLTLEQMIRGWPSLTAPDLSADGQHVVYAYRGAVWLTDAAGGEPQRLTEGWSPRWSPTADLVAVLQGERAQIWLCDPGGTERQLTDDPRGISAFAWSSDGQQLAVVSPLDEPPAPDGGQSALTSIVEVHRKRLPPGCALSVIDVSTGQICPVATSAPGVTWSSLAWSPDGQQIALSESVVAATQGEAQSHLAVVELTSGKVRHPVGQTWRLVGSPRWAPDGSRLALPYSPHDLAYPFRMVCGVVTADGGEVQRFATDYFLWLYDSLCWHPDNRTLYCLGNRGITRQVLRVDTLTGQVSPLTAAPGVHDELRISADGQWLLCTYRTPTARSQVYLLSTDGDERRPLTEVDDPLQRLQLAPTDIVRWRAPDGLELEGLLVKPLEYEPGGRYPTIVDLHGGPVAYLHAEFHAQLHWLAAQGYLVFAPDFRGSQLYGWFGPPGYQEDDFQDVMAGVDWLVDAGYADPDRLAVQGHSYGSSLAAWAIGHTHRFQAAVLKSSSYHNEVSYGTAPFRGSPLLAGVLGGKPWEVPENYRHYSPLTYIHTARTPTLILHGELDDIVQAEMMYVWLYQAGVEVEFVKYLGEGHVFGKPEHRADSWRRRLAWFDKHLHFPR